MIGLQQAMKYDADDVVAVPLTFGQTFAYEFNEGSRRIVWNVEAAVQVAMTKSRYFISLANIRECLNQNHGIRSAISLAKLRRVNLELPLIIVPAPDGLTEIIIDGWHRMMSAHIFEVPRLPIVRLTREEEMALRLEDVILL